MKPNDLKNLYPITPDAHNTIIRALNAAGDSRSEPIRRKRNLRKLAVAFAIISALAALTAVGYAADFFGLRSERVGKYGLDLTITEDSSQPAEKKPVRPIISYIPEGCKPVGDEEDGKYWYATDGKEYGAEISVGVFLTDAGEYRNAGRYVVESEALEINGHQAVIGTQQLEVDGEKSYFGVEYFEDWGYVAHYSGNNRDELLKFMQGVDLEEDVDYTEPPTSAKTIDPLPEDDYAFKMREDTRFAEIGKPFGYTERRWIENGEKTPDSFTLTVKSVEDRDSYDGLDKDGFMYGERFSEWFDEDNKLITPYIRQDYDFGDDGLNEQITHIDTLTERRFIVVTVDVTANADTKTEGAPITAWATPIIRKDGDSYDYPTGYGQAFLMYQPADHMTVIDWKKGDTRTYTYGILVDNEVLDRSCIEFISERYEVDHKAATVEKITENICVMLRGGGAE